ncbi:hypothetical protein BUE80_DR011587 [Diplocarpon rosae]|nr:hypothetical protein BUE80_DR011587 [Diplocarpon rosae]
MENLGKVERKIIVGIDFGTTYSGLAYAQTLNPDHHFPIDSWPSSLEIDETVSCAKVPTQIRYIPQGTQWGFQIPSIVDRHQWFKLGLEEGHAVSEGEQSSPEVLTRAYLAKLYDYLMATLERKVGTETLQNTPMEFYLTVPAIWTEAAKDKTLGAFRAARPDAAAFIVSEPEAAAVYALQGLDPHELTVGDSFVLCDAGGGTVDLISYTIIALRPILKVREATIGTGDLCGASFLNRRFAELITRKLGQEPGWDDEVLADAMERFETVKVAYSAANQDGYRVPVPGLADNPDLGVRRGRYKISPSEMREIHEPIIAGIIELVQRQISDAGRAIKAVLLVGGFGENNHLRERLQMSLDGIEVLQPANAWTSVVRGAVMMGMSRADASLSALIVESRAARKNYGVELLVLYNAARHSAEKRYWCARHQQFKAAEMKWFIRKGDAVEEMQPHDINFVFTTPVMKCRPESLKIDVWSDSESAQAPVHKTDTVRKLATLVADLSHMTTADLQSTIVTLADGHQYFSIPGCIEATFYSAWTRYVLLCQGNRYDTVTAEYA